MTAPARLVVALEGPSDSGKTTLASCLRSRLTVPVTLLPCYADCVGAPGRLPPPVGENADAQLRSLEFYLDLDRVRRAAASGPSDAAVVIADRSWLGLLAHVYAVEKTGGPTAYERARALVTGRSAELLQPDLVLFLRLDAGVRRARVEERERDLWFTSESFNEAFNAFYLREAPSLIGSRLRTVDASANAARTCDTASELIAAALGDRGA